MLLDTCALLWLTQGGGELTGETLEIIDGAPIVHISAITGFEIGVKHAKGKLHLPARPADWMKVVLEHHDIDFLAGGDDLAGMDVLFGPAHFGYMDQAFDTVFQFHERAVIGDIGNLALEFALDGVFFLDIFPRVRFELFDAERYALGFRIDLDDLHFDGLADR